MKITNVSHFVSIAGKELCAENIQFIIQGAKWEALAATGNSVALRSYKNWLKAAEVEKTPLKENKKVKAASRSHNKQSMLRCENCGGKLVTTCVNKKCDWSPVT